jgi:hypothetical protein
MGFGSVAWVQHLLLKNYFAPDPEDPEFPEAALL